MTFNYSVTMKCLWNGDETWTAIHWCQMQLLCQLFHNHFYGSGGACPLLWLSDFESRWSLPTVFMLQKLSESRKITKRGCYRLTKSHFSHSVESFHLFTSSLVFELTTTEQSRRNATTWNYWLAYYTEKTFPTFN